MDYAEWAPYYRRIQADFGFDFAREEATASVLRRLLPESARVDPRPLFEPRLRGRTAVVVGLAPGAGPPPLWRWQEPPPAPVVVAADGATATCLEAGFVPELIVTDLDGPVPSEIAANARGAVAVIHAHGDNRPAVEHWVPQFSGPVVGSWAGPPGHGLVNVGGFTDGDRAAFLAAHYGARRVLLWGFDFERTEETEPSARSQKLAKLRWAEALLAMLSAREPSRVFRWRPDGSIVPFPTQVGGQATQ